MATKEKVTKRHQGAFGRLRERCLIIPTYFLEEKLTEVTEEIVSIVKVEDMEEVLNHDELNVLETSEDERFDPMAEYGPIEDEDLEDINEEDEISNLFDENLDVEVFEQEAIEPDIILIKNGHRLSVEIPGWKIRSRYKFTRTGNTKIDKKGREILNVIDERLKLLKRIGEVIIKELKEYILSMSDDNAHLLLKPISQKEIAKKVGTDKSTLSRIATECYIEFPNGENIHLSELLEYSRTDLPLSKYALAKEILRIIAVEDKNNPFSDKEIAKKLKERIKEIKGIDIDISRRMIGFIRDSYQIPPTKYRKTKSR